uniref:Uncharacterized protein n=1 Tax=Rhizophora mucronata TaxID=61149 RepID=A0A2P2QXH9_RHIMU
MENVMGLPRLIFLVFVWYSFVMELVEL